MNLLLIVVTLFSCINQCEGNYPHFIAQSRDEPVERIHHTVQNSKIIQKLKSDACIAPRYPQVSSYNNAALNLFHNHRACATWSAEHYWNAALQLFGRPYPLHQNVNLPPEYKCFCTDSQYQYYIHDAERYAIMEQWPLYEYPAFWSFIQNYPDYNDCILAIDEIATNDCAIQQQLSSRAMHHIQSEAQRIHQQRWHESMLEQQKRFVVQNTFNSQKLVEQASEYSELLDLYKTYELDGDYLETRQAVMKDMQQRGACYEAKTYTLSQNVRALLRKNGCDAGAYTSVYGNQLQQLVHQDCISLLEQTSIVSVSSVAYAHKDSLVECIDAAREYNQAGLTQKALHITDFCRALLDYGKAIVTGAAQGVVGAAQDCLEHPIETALCVAAGEYVFAYQLCKVLFNVAEIGVISLIDSEQGAKKLHDYIQPLNNVIDALYNKEVSLRDVVQGVTQFAVHWKAQNKLLGGLGKFYKATKAKALEFAAKNPLASPEQYLLTPEGFVFKAHFVAENNKLPTHCATGSLGQAPKRELVLDRVSTYEQAINQGLEIIGDVDVHSGVPMVGKQGPVLDKLCGRRWHGYDVTLRLDHDAIKGAHINVTDYRNGKCLSAAIPFEGSENMVKSLCRPLNTKASLESAKLVFEEVGDARGLSVVTEALNDFKK